MWTPSVKRGRVCHLKLLLALASVFLLGSHNRSMLGLAVLAVCACIWTKAAASFKFSDVDPLRNVVSSSSDTPEPSAKHNSD
jgi:hypothetical protein